ncbi:MAG: gluconokinase [Anaerolineaceae bacterium]
MVTGKSQQYAIGIDLGTGSCKTTLLNPNGKILGHGAAKYPSVNAKSQWQEQHPESLLYGVINSVRDVLSTSGVNPADCLGLTIGGALHSLTALDGNDVPLLGVLTWADSRAAKQADELKNSPKAHENYLRTGCPAHPLYPFSKIIWLRETHPELFRKAAYFISAKEYINFRLTGKRTVDYCIAAASGLLDVHRLQWDEEILKIAGISADQLFSLSDPRDEIGQLLLDMAAQMGLLAGTKVYQGSSDAVNSSIGSGTIFPYQITCMVGTSGAIRGISNHPVLDEQERTWCYAIDKTHYIIGGAINNGGLAVNWFKDALSVGLPEGQKGPTFDQILEWANQIEAGSEGVLCLPFFTSERSPYWNSKARGVYYGLQLAHDQRHMSRALLEGIAFRLRSVLDALDDIQPNISEIRVSGGFVQSPVWLQLTADILNRTLSIPGDKETSGVAAALWVYLANGAIKSIEDLASMVPIVSKVEPNSKNKAVYDRQYSIYKALYQSMKPIFELSSNS